MYCSNNEKIQEKVVKGEYYDDDYDGRGPNHSGDHTSAKEEQLKDRSDNEVQKKQKETNERRDLEMTNACNCTSAQKNPEMKYERETDDFNVVKNHQCQNISQHLSSQASSNHKYTPSDDANFLNYRKSIN